MTEQETRSSETATGAPDSGAAPDGAAATGPGTSPPDVALAHPDDEGNTPAAWIACGSVIAAALVGGFAVVFTSWLLGVVAVLVAVVGLLVGFGMSRAAGRSHGGVHGEHGVEAHGAGRADG